MAIDSPGLTVVQQLKQATAQLKSVSETPRLDAELLLCHALGWPRAALYTRNLDILSAEQRNQFNSLLEQRSEGRPVAYLLQTQEFWSLPLMVNESVLIPRADTELLVATALRFLGKQTASVLELGTGSGAIVLALATERPDLQITACDISVPALAVATHNAENLAIQSISFIQSDWFAQLPERRFDAIISNPPYIPDNDPHLNSGGVRFEPRIALVGGVDGLNAIRHIAQHSRTHLVPSGRLILEHGYDQGPGVCSILRDWGYTDIVTLKDAADHARVTHGQYNSGPI